MYVVKGKYMNTIKRFVIHATSEGKPNTATVEHYTRAAAIEEFKRWDFFADTVIRTIDELGPIDDLD